MYHNLDRKKRFFLIEYTPIQSIRFCIPKPPCGGRSCSRIISRLQCKMLLMSQTPRMAVIRPSDETEPRQLEANVLNPLVECIGRSDLTITEFIKTPDKFIQDSALLLEICKGYNENSMWRKMIENPLEFKGFSVNNGLLCCSMLSKPHLLVIPDVNHKGEG